MKPKDSRRETLYEHFMRAIFNLRRQVDTVHPSHRLVGIGFIAPDSIDSVGAFLRFEGDFPADSDDYILLSPVEWQRPAEEAFNELNHYLASRLPREESSEEYRARVSDVFAACADAVREHDLPTTYGPDLYITFAGVDPNDILEAAEKQFVRETNAEEIFESWCAEFDVG